MSDKPTPLALPWPAWHTDEHRAFRLLASDSLSDRGVYKMYQDHHEFLWTHARWSYRPSRSIPPREEKEACAVMRQIVATMADRFLAIISRRDAAVVKAYFTRKINGRKTRKAA